jgi:hypothetical protein
MSLLDKTMKQLTRQLSTSRDTCADRYAIHRLNSSLYLTYEILFILLDLIEFELIRTSMKTKCASRIQHIHRKIRSTKHHAEQLQTRTQLPIVQTIHTINENHPL